MRAGLRSEKNLAEGGHRKSHQKIESVDQMNAPHMSQLQHRHDPTGCLATLDFYLILFFETTIKLIF